MAWLHCAMRQGSVAALKVPCDVPFPLRPATAGIFIAMSRMPCHCTHMYSAFQTGLLKT